MLFALVVFGALFAFATGKPVQRPTTLPTLAPTTEPTSYDQSPQALFLNAVKIDGDALCDFYGGVENKAVLANWDCEDKTYRSIRNWKSGINEVLGFNEEPIDPNYGRLTSINFLNLNLGRAEIPSSFGNLAALSELNIIDCSLAGTIPKELDKLVKLKSLQLELNSLTGDLPHDLFTLPHLEIIILSDNKLQGTISSQIVALRDLFYLDLSNNLLEGVIPSQMVKLSKLKTLYLGLNSLVGRIPILPDLQELDLRSNQLSGSLNMRFFDTLTSLHYLSLYYNLLTGELPPTIGLLNQSLTLLDFGENSLRGHLPPSLGDLTILKELYLGGNVFSGSLGSWIGHLKRLRVFQLGNNRLGSSLPSELGDATSLRTLYLDGNQFTSLVPRSFANLHNLSTLILSRNVFVNDGLDFISPVLQPNLTCIDVSSNNFTGIIDPNIFTGLKQLQTFAAGTNCFTMPSLPSEICAATNLTTLSLNGLSSGAGCKKFFWWSGLRKWPFQFVGTYSQFTMNSHLPPCLFSMPKLATLHLAGLGVQGPIPNIPFSPSLVDLSLSHNRLTSRLPTYLQKSLPAFTRVDLSSNKLSGDFTGNACRKGCSYHNGICKPSKGIPDSDCFVALDIRLNRFSGLLPDNVANWKEVNLLESNLFNCDALFTRLPKFDPFYDSFSCGSNFLIEMFCVWLAIVICAALVLSERGKGAQERAAAATTNEGLSWTEFGHILFEFLERDWHQIRSYNDLSFNLCGVELSMHRVLPLMFASVASSKGEAKKTAAAPGSAKTVALRTGSIRISMDDSKVRLSYSISGKGTASAASIEDPNVALSDHHRAADNPSEHTVDVDIVIVHILEHMTEMVALAAISVTLCVVLLVVYGIASPFTDMLENSYAWSVSAAYRSGTPCAVTLFFFWLASLLSIYALIRMQQKKSRTINTEKAIENTALGFTGWSDYSMTFFHVSRVLLLALANIVIVFTVNASYVYIVLKFDRTIQDAAKLGLVIFMLFWDKAALPTILHSKHKYNFISRLGMSDKDIERFMDDWLPGLTFDVVLLTINALLVPIFAAMCTSSTCFLETFRPEPPLSSSYTFTYESNGKNYPYTASTSFTPTFSYSYGCSSLILTLYSPIYIGIAMFTTVCVPVLKHLEARVVPQSEMGLRRFFVQTYSDFVLLLTIGIVCPLVGLAIGVGIITRAVRMQYLIVSLAVDENRFRNNTAASVSSPSTLCMGEECIVSALRQTLKKKECIVSALRQTLECIKGCCTSQKSSSNAEKSASEKKQPLRIDAVTEECKKVPVSFSARWVLYFFSPLLLAFFMFDIAGDTQGATGAAWAPVVMILVPWLVIGVVEIVYKQKEDDSQGSRKQQKADEETEERGGSASTLGQLDVVEMASNPMMIPKNQIRLSASSGKAASSPASPASPRLSLSAKIPVGAVLELTDIIPTIIDEVAPVPALEVEPSESERKGDTTTAACISSGSPDLLPLPASSQPLEETFSSVCEQ